MDNLKAVGDYWRKVKSGELPAPSPNEISITACAVDEAVSKIAELEEQKERWVDIAMSISSKHDELKAKLATPVRLPKEIEPTVEAICEVIPTANPDEYACCIGADMWNGAVKKCRKLLLKQGFTVEGDE